MPIPPIQRRRHRNRRRKRLGRARRRPWPVGAPAAADSAVAEVRLAEFLARGPALVLRIMLHTRGRGGVEVMLHAGGRVKLMALLKS